MEGSRRGSCGRKRIYFLFFIFYFLFSIFYLLFVICDLAFVIFHLVCRSIDLQSENRTQPEELWLRVLRSMTGLSLNTMTRRERGLEKTTTISLECCGAGTSTSKIW